jgi:hypothetical protein
MKITALLLFGLAFSAVTLTVRAEPTGHAARGPLELTESQMDAVSAGAVYVSTLAKASALGLGGLAYTNTETHTKSSPVVEMGFGQAKAIACCGPNAMANVLLTGAADGLIVKEINKVVMVRTPMYTIAMGWIIIVSINPPSLKPFPWSR